MPRPERTPSTRAAAAGPARVDDPALRRLRFWLYAPFAGDAALLVIGGAAVALGNPLGWYLVWFALARAVIGVVAVIWVAPRVLGRRRSGSAR